MNGPAPPVGRPAPEPGRTPSSREGTRAADATGAARSAALEKSGPGERDSTAHAPSIEDLMVPVLRPAHRFALRLAGNEMDADDLLQEAAIRACRYFHRFQPGTNFRAWFFTILANCFYNQESKARRRGPQLSLDDAPTLHLYMKTDAARSGPEENPAQAFVSRFDGEEIGQALSELPEEFRAVALLYFLEDLRYAEIARVLDIPVGTVRSRLHRGRRILQKLLWDLAFERGLVTAQSGIGLE